MVPGPKEQPTWERGRSENCSFLFDPFGRLGALTMMTLATEPVHAQQDRWRGSRTARGRPGTLHLRGRPRRLTGEIVDLSAGGVRLLAPEETFRVGERGSLHFVLAEGRAREGADRRGGDLRDPRV